MEKLETGFVPVGFFEDTPGQKSMNRLISFEMVQVGIIIALGTLAGVLTGNVDLTGGITLIAMALSFITGGVTSKELGKRAENKNK